MKNFIRGMCSVFQLIPLQHEREKIQMSLASDEEAIRSDWEAIGNDLAFSMKNANNELSSIETDISKRIANIWDRVGICSKKALNQIEEEVKNHGLSNVQK